MRRGELYRVKRGATDDPKRFRVYAIVSRQALIDSRYSTVICAPVYTVYEGLETQVPIGIDEGLKHDCSIHCDALLSIPKSLLTHYIGMLAPHKLRAVDEALRVALELADEASAPTAG